MTLCNFLPRREEFVGLASEALKHQLPVQPNTCVHSWSMSSFTKIGPMLWGMMLWEHLWESFFFLPSCVGSRNAEEQLIDVYLADWDGRGELRGWWETDLRSWAHRWFNAALSCLFSHSHMFCMTNNWIKSLHLFSSRVINMKNVSFLPAQSCGSQVPPGKYKPK